MSDGLAEYDSLAVLPAEARALLDAAAEQDFQFGAAWFATVAATALPPGARPRLLLWREHGRAVALLALQVSAEGHLAGLTSPYTTRFRPLLAADADPAAARRAGHGFARACRRHGVLRLDALDPDWPGQAALLAGLRAGLMLPARFAHFGNWHADVTGLGWAAWLAGRPGELRETIRRRMARAARDPAIGFDLIAGPDGLEDAIAAYEDVYARSWKQAEPYPAFGPALLRAAAPAGVLRLGVLRRDGTPLAAQYWILSGGVATVLKLAHDETARALSPGTVLTGWMIRHLLEHDCVRGLDFGRGDDAYKSAWTGARRQREGLLLCPPGHPAGLAALLRAGARRMLLRARQAGQAGRA